MSAAAEEDVRAGLGGFEPAPFAPMESGPGLEEGSRLLEGVLARCTLDRAPIVLLLPCHGEASLVGERLATAAAARLGRTLLVDAAEEAPWLSSGRLVAERDARVPALHRAQLAGGLVEQVRSGQPIAAELEAISRAYRLVAIVCAAAGASARALALAPLCSGTLLLVQAGRTRLQDVEAAARAVAATGGVVLGTVLTEAPARLPRWLARHG